MASNPTQSETSASSILDISSGSLQAYICAGEDAAASEPRPRPLRPAMTSECHYSYREIAEWKWMQEVGGRGGAEVERVKEWK